MGILDVEDLLAPSLGARPYQEAALLALEFHPDGQMHRSTIVRELESQVQQFGDNLLFVDWSDPAATSQLLQMAAEIAAPHREHIRGVVVEGPGHWTMHGLVGPLASSALKDIMAQTWGKVDRIAHMPPPLPPAPSAKRWWLGVAALGVLTTLALNLSIASHRQGLEHPIEASFVEARGGIWVDFDVNEEALVSLVSLRNDQLHIVLNSMTAGDKTMLAMGDGKYRLHAKGDGVLLSSADQPMNELTAWIQIANQSDNPLQVLAQSIQQAYPERGTALYVKK